jgi:predicted esterase
MAAQAADLLWQDHLAQLRDSRRAEWDAKSITLGDKTMKFDYRVFGPRVPRLSEAGGQSPTSVPPGIATEDSLPPPPPGGRSLFISMHGGGSTTSDVNDSQWQNQVKLYTPSEGVYLAPRAPTDAWNMWHEAHMDALFDRLIEDAVALMDVNPDRVYLMGYSAGGDGVYQVAPRMADRFAAAAMMAGHPNDASPLNLRNLPFTIHCGGNDSAFKRNQVAKEWGEKLDALHAADPEGYEHLTVIHEGMPHWMNRTDAVAVDWMLAHTRNPAPKTVTWRQDDVTEPRLYWLALPPDQLKPGVEVRASIRDQTITIDAPAISSVTLLLSDALLDLDQPVTVIFNSTTSVYDRPARTIANLAAALAGRADPRLLCSARITVNSKN